MTNATRERVENLMRSDQTGEADTQRPDGLYRALVGLWAHHERMLWSRVQTLIAVQAAVVGGSYAIGNHQLAAGFMVAGAALCLVVYKLSSKDLLDRDVNLGIINQLGRFLLPQQIVQSLAKDGKQGPFVFMQAEPPTRRPFMRSRYLVRIVVWAFTVFDIILALLHFLEIAPVLPSTG